LTEIDALRREKEEIESRHGPWTAHNVRLADGLFTIAPGPTGDEVKLRRIVQVASDLCGGRFDGLRVLDLACLEGMYSLEFARRGAEVVAIEGREANLEKARFAARALGLDVDFQAGDVRGLSRERHGEFDVVLCLGILYHLDADDVVAMVDEIRAVARNVAIFDTSVALARGETRRYGDLELQGEILLEHASGSTTEEKQGRLWSSLDNPRSFLPSLPSLLRLLRHSGFPTVVQAHLPAEPTQPRGRVTLVALARDPIQPLLTPEPGTDAIPERRLPRRRPGAWRAAVPRRLRRFARRSLRP
jgi:SAM-dependent methyltransferase